MKSNVVISVNNVSKKFCRNLKRSMAYGVLDLSKNLVGIRPNSARLRKDEFWAVKDVSLELKKGEVLGLIGVNGSGKSTLLRLITGIFPPDKGEIAIRGRIGALIAVGAGFHPHMTGRENIYLNGTILGMTRKEIDSNFQDIIDFSEIGSAIDSPVSIYSSGMKVRLGFSIAAHINPEILLIDEVLAVGDIGFRAKCSNKILSLIQNTAVVFVSHSMQHISNICTKLLVMNNGEIEYATDDVGAGIDYYFSKFQISDTCFFGGEKATIHDVKISNGLQCVGGKEELNLKHGEDITIEMKLEIDASIKDISINVLIKDLQSKSVADCYSEFCNYKLEAKPVSNIRLTLPNLQLNMGLYSITIIVRDLLKKEFLIRADNMARLHVENTYASWASHVLKGEWSQD